MSKGGFLIIKKFFNFYKKDLSPKHSFHLIRILIKHPQISLAYFPYYFLIFSFRLS